MNIQEHFKDKLRYNLIFEEDNNTMDIIASFISWSVKRNKKCYYFTDKNCTEELGFYLKQENYDIADLVANERLIISSAVDFYVMERTFVKYNKIVQLINDAIKQGFSGVSIISERDCFLESSFSEEILFQYEKVFNKIIEKFPIAAITSYNIDRFGLDTIFEIANLNPNFIYRREDKIFLYNKGRSILSKKESMELVFYSLRELYRIKKENEIYQFISRLSCEISYKKDEREILEISINNICKSMYVNCGIGIAVIDGKLDIENPVSYNVPNEIFNLYTNIVFKNELHKNEKWTKINYVTYDTNTLDESISRILNLANIKYSTIIPLKVDGEIHGYLWLCTKNKYISLEAFNNNTEFLFRICENITKMIIEYKKNKKILESFMQSREMKLLGEISGQIAHEFNNILTPIMGYSQMLKSKIDDDNLIKYISIIEESAKDGANIVEKVQEYSKVSNKKKGIVDIDRAIVKSIEVVEAKWLMELKERKIDIKLQTKLNSRAFVEGVPTEIREIFINILSNAYDAMPEGGTIIIKSYNHKKNVYISIKDNGIGMDEEVKSRIFEPFFTTKEERGNGFGLPIIQGIITDMKGEIEVISEKNLGTEFIIKLPLKFGVVHEVKNTSTSDLKNKYKILIIDDNIAVAETVSEMLSSIGHNTSYFTDSGDIMKVFNEGDFDCVLCDFGMLNYLGIQLSKIFKSQKPELGFIIMTGWPEGVNKSEMLYVDNIIQKPFLLDDICEIIDKVMDEKK